MTKTVKVKMLIMRSAKYIPIIMMIALLTLALARTTVAPAGGTVNPYDACLA